MRVQKIAETSIYTQKNNMGMTVSFSGKNPKTAKKSMPGVSVKLAEGAQKKPQTMFDEFCSMANDAKRAVRKSYAKSEIHRAVVKPMKKAWGEFSMKAPTLAKGIKITAVAAVGVGLFEAVKGKISE